MSGTGECESCREILSKEDDPKLADAVDAKHPGCTCEKHSTGVGSPGAVADSERLVRLISSPRDFDPIRGLLLEQPFYKVYGNGLSVCRSIASDADVIDLASEALAHAPEQPPRALMHICEVEVAEVRNMNCDHGVQPFCIYDQTVSRLDETKPPVTTHAGIFQRLPSPGIADRKRLQKDLAGQLREKFIAGTLDLARFRNGMLVALNRRAQNREFEAKAPDTPTSLPI
jgi:hypothetical protein